MGFKGLKWFKRAPKNFKVVVDQDYAHDMGVALGRLGLTADYVTYTGEYEYTITGRWTPMVYGDRRTMEALTMLPVREAVVF